MAIIQFLFDDFFGGFDLIEIGLTLIMIRFLLTNLVSEWTIFSVWSIEVVTQKYWIMGGLLSNKRSPIPKTLKVGHCRGYKSNRYSKGRLSRFFAVTLRKRYHHSPLRISCLKSPFWALTKKSISCLCASQKVKAPRGHAFGPLLRPTLHWWKSWKDHKKIQIKG